MFETPNESIPMQMLITLCTLAYTSFQIYSACPATHVYFAELYFEKCKPEYSSKERAAFLRGTLFPDIRSYVGISRSKTHDKNVKLADVQNAKNAFTAGKLFHTYVDEKREKIAQREKIYNEVLILPRRYQGTFIKLVEDELCHSKINNKVTVAALKSTDKEAEQLVARHKVRGWHRLMSNYLKQSPLTLLKERVKNKQGYLKLDADMVVLCSGLLEDFKENEKVKTYMNTLVSEFEKLLTI